MKKLLALLMAFALAFQLATPVFAETGNAGGTCGDNLTWTLTTDGTLTISGSGEMNSYLYADQVIPWGEYSKQITTVKIKSGVTSIGACAFWGCVALTSVTIPKSVTEIGNSAFSGCSELQKVYYDGSNTQWSRMDTGNFELTRATVIYGDLSDASGTCGDNLTWTLTEDGTLIISGSGYMNYSDKTAPWNSYREQITAVIMNSGVTSIKSEAFADCGALTRVTVPKSVTSIGDDAFYRCYDLKEIHYEGTATQWASISMGKGMDDYPFTRATIIYGDLSDSGTCGDNLTWTFSPNGALTISGSGDMSYDKIAPWYCYREQITSVAMKPGITSIGVNAFHECAKLTSVTIPQSVTSIGDSAFDGCGSLIRVEIPAGVTSIGGCTFYDCSSLTSVKIPNGVTSIGWYAFAGCDSLTSVTIPKSVTSIDGGAFASCSSLNSVTIPAGVTSIGELTFEGCSSLTSVIIPESVTSIGRRAFSSCGKLTGVTIPKDVTSIGEATFEGCSSLTSIEIPVSVTSIGVAAFSDCSGLTKVTIPESVTSIGLSAFSGCDGLTSIEIPQSITEIGELAFSHCKRLRSIQVDSKNENYTSIDGVLFSKDGTRLLQYPDGKDGATCTILASVVSIDLWAFYGCGNLRDILVDDKNTSYTSVDGILFSKDGTQLLRYPVAKADATYVIPESVTCIGYAAFSGCGSLTSMEIPQGVTEIGEPAFSDCKKLCSIQVDSKNENYTSIDGVLFSKDGRRLLQYPNGKTDTTYTIPESVYRIGGSAFYNCGSLTCVKIPESVVEIAITAFYGCDGLKDAYYGGPESAWRMIETTIGDNGVLSKSTIHYDATW